MSKSRIVTVSASSAKTASVNFDLNGINGDYDEVVGYLSVTAASGTSPTLDIDFQTKVNGVYYTHTSFTQATGTTTERKNFPAPVGVDGRMQITIGGTTPSFTFSLDLECKSN